MSATTGSPSADWPSVTLGDLATDVTKGESIQWQGETYQASGIPFIRTVNVQPQGLDLSDVAFVSTESHARMKRSQLRANDLLISIAGTLGRSCIVPAGCVPANINQDVALVRIERDDAYLPYVLWALRSDVVGHQIDRVGRGAGRIHLNLQQVRSLAFPLPPPPEQRRIAALLDKADAIRRKRQQAICLADDLLRSAFLDMFGDPVTNPKGWPVQALGTCAAFVGGGTPSRQTPAYYGGAVCWATSKDMKGEELHDTQEHITPLAIANSATKLVPPGTILVVVKSKVLMHTLPVAVTCVPACFGQDLKGIVTRGIPARYVANHLRLGSAALLAQARGVNTEGLTLEHLRGYRLMRPPDTLVQRYLRLDEHSRALSYLAAAAASEARRLFDSSAQATFSGRT